MAISLGKSRGQVPMILRQHLLHHHLSRPASQAEAEKGRVRGKQSRRYAGTDTDELRV